MESSECCRREGRPCRPGPHGARRHARGGRVTNFIHTFNPEVVVLGGGVTHAGDLLFAPARAAVEMRIMPAYRGTFEIVSAVLGDKSAALGAVAAAVSLL